MRKVDVNTGTALFFTILSLLLLISVPYQIAKPRLVMGRALTALDASLFPYIALGAMMLLSSLFLYRNLRGKLKLQPFNFTVSELCRTSISLIIFFCYALLMEPIGFMASSGLALLTLTAFYGNRNWWVGIAVSVCFPVIIYFLFLYAFQVYLPEFPL